MKAIALSVISAAMLGLSFAAHAGSPDPDDVRPVRAVAKFVGCTDPNISGIGSLVEQPSDDGVKLVKIRLRVKGLTDGLHAVHIHEAGQCQPCSAAGGHFDPGPNTNPSPDGNHPYHLGDLVNMLVKGGVGRLTTSTTRVTLSPGPLSLFDVDGSAFIIHVNPDTYCPNGPVPGCAGGPRAACGIIEAAPSRPEDDWID